MQQIPDNLDLMLPFGETLRSFLEQPFITPSDLKHTLRARGVFQGRSEKRDTIPILTSCLLSPGEFDELRQSHFSREDNQKTTTRTLAWRSSKSLLDALPTELPSGLLGGEFSNYKVIGSPKFVAVAGDPNTLLFDFEIEREDLSKSWACTKSVFKGSLRIRRAPDGKQATFVLTHTAEETREVNHRLVQRLHQHFLESGVVTEDEEMVAITFSSFNNEGRIAFFRSLTDKAHCSDFTFEKVSDLGACPEDQVPLPTNLKWMEDNVSRLNLNGRALQDTFFIKDKACHKYLLLYSVDAVFRFNLRGNSGTCSVRFEFADFMSSKDRGAEFQVNISTLSLDAGSGGISKPELRGELLQRVNEYKLKQFDLHKMTSIVDPLLDGVSPLTVPIQLEANFGSPPTPPAKIHPAHP